MADANFTDRANTRASSLDDLAATDFGPLMSIADVRECEKNEESWGEKRRITLLALARSKTELLRNAENLEENCKVFLDMADAANEWLAHLKAGIFLAESAHLRLLSVAAALEKQAREANHD